MKSNGKRLFSDTLTIDRELDDHEYEIFYNFACGCVVMRWVGRCAECGAWFESRRNDAKFCSGKCRKRAYRRKPEIVKYCPVCDSRFKTLSNNRVYCSDACYHREKYLRRKNKIQS